MVGQHHTQPHVVCEGSKRMIQILFQTSPFATPLPVFKWSRMPECIRFP